MKIAIFGQILAYFGHIWGEIYFLIWEHRTLSSSGTLLVEQVKIYDSKYGLIGPIQIDELPQLPQHPILHFAIHFVTCNTL